MEAPQQSRSRLLVAKRPDVSPFSNNSALRAGWALLRPATAQGVRVPRRLVVQRRFVSTVADLAGRRLGTVAPSHRPELGRDAPACPLTVADLAGRRLGTVAPSHRPELGRDAPASPPTLSDLAGRRLGTVAPSHRPELECVGLVPTITSAGLSMPRVRARALIRGWLSCALRGRGFLPCHPRPRIGAGPTRCVTSRPPPDKRHRSCRWRSSLGVARL